MEQVFHLYITVNSEEVEIDKFNGTLVDYACEKLNKLMSEESFQAQYGDNVRVINITNSFWSHDELSKKTDSTLYHNVDYCRLSVYLAKNET